MLAGRVGERRGALRSHEATPAVQRESGRLECRGHTESGAHFHAHGRPESPDEMEQKQPPLVPEASVGDDIGNAPGHRAALLHLCSGEIVAG